MNKSTLEEIEKKLDKAFTLIEEIENRAFHIGNTDIRTRAIRAKRAIKYANSDIKDIRKG